MSIKKINNRENCEGVALLIALWVLVMLSVTAVSFIFAARMELKMIGYAEQEAKAFNLARAGLEKAIAELSRDSNGVDAYNEPWLNQYLNTESAKEALKDKEKIWPVWKEIDFEDNQGETIGSYTLKFSDESGKLNINAQEDDYTKSRILNRILELIGVENKEEVSDAILDWMDPDDAHRLSGAEDNYYQGLATPYSCKNGPLDTLGELFLVKGITKKMLWGYSNSKSASLSRGLFDFITIYPKHSRLFYFNINTADIETIKALLGPEYEDIAVAIDRQRSGPDGLLGTEDDQPFENINAVFALEEFKRIGDLLQKPEKEAVTFNMFMERIGVVSRIWTIESTGIAAEGKVRKKITAVVDRTNIPARIIYWRE